MLIIAQTIFSQPADLILLSEPYGGGIWTVHSDGSDLVKINDFGWYGEFSKAGEKIAFSKYYKSGIWTMDLDGSNKRQLTSSGIHPSWAPLGDRIVYATGTTYSHDGRMRIMNSDGTGDALLTTRIADRPNWAHFSDKIVFESYEDGIWVINPDGTGETQIIAISNAVFPSWAPDDSKILFSISGSGIYMVDPDGSNIIQLTATYGLCPSMGSDGRVAYIGADDEVYILDTATHIETLFAAGFEAPDWNTGINTSPYNLGVALSGAGVVPFSSTGSPP